MSDGERNYPNYLDSSNSSINSKSSGEVSPAEAAYRNGVKEGFQRGARHGQNVGERLGILRAIEAMETEILRLLSGVAREYNNGDIGVLDLAGIADVCNVFQDQLAAIRQRIEGEGDE